MFWRTDDYARVISAYVRRVEDPGFGSIVSLGGLACRRTLLKTADGEQHLLLRAPDQVVQIRCVGEDLAFDPFARSSSASGFGEAGHTASISTS